MSATNTFGWSPAKSSSGCSSLDSWPEKLGWPFVNLYWVIQSIDSAPRLHVLGEYKHWNAPVSLILSLSSCRCPTASHLNQISPSSHSFIQACGMWVVCAASPVLAVPFAFIYTVSVNIPLYPTAADDISQPSQAFVRQLNPVPIPSVGQQWNGKR